MKVKATAEGYQQWTKLREMAARYNVTTRHARDIYSTRAECAKKQCPYMMTAQVKIGKRLTDRMFCTISGKIVYSKVKCPLKEEKHAAVATAEAERPSTDIEIC